MRSAAKPEAWADPRHGTAARPAAVQSRSAGTRRERGGWLTPPGQGWPTAGPAAGGRLVSVVQQTPGFLPRCPTPLRRRPAAQYAHGPAQRPVEGHDVLRQATDVERLDERPLPRPHAMAAQHVGAAGLVD